MLKFFRKIRQKLLTENRFSKYLVYAIGEILLVVIGILIALSINNWNEQEKLKTEYIDDLKIIKENLKKDARTISINLKNGNLYAKKFMANLNTDSLIIDGSSIIINIGRPGLYLDDSGYRTAKSKNTLNLIQNDSLNNILHEYYVRKIEIIKKSASIIEQIGTTLKTYYLESGHQKEGVSKKEIMNSLMQQGPFIDYLNLYISERDELLEELKTTKEVNAKLTKTIDIELMQIE